MKVYSSVISREVNQTLHYFPSFNPKYYLEDYFRPERKKWPLKSNQLTVRSISCDRKPSKLICYEGGRRNEVTYKLYNIPKYI